MAKVAFSKLGLTKNINVGSFEWNDQTIEVKAYLPIQEKMQLMQNVLNNCQDENNFINEAKMSMFMTLEMVYAYSNINFTEKQKSDPAKMFDLLAGSGFLEDFFTVMPQTEYKSIAIWLDKTANHIYDYRNSIYGILDALKEDYSNLEFDAEALREKIADPQTLDILKGVLTKLG